MAYNGTKKSDLIEKGFSGGFVKSFKRISNRRKRSSDNSTAATEDVAIDTVMLMTSATNTTEKTKLESIIKDAATDVNFVTGNITCKKCGTKLYLFNFYISKQIYFK